MPIYKDITYYDSSSNSRKVTGVDVSFIGRVINIFKKADVKVMSDIWVDATMATVMDYDGKIKNVVVNYNFELDDSNGRAVIDASPELIDQYIMIVEAAKEADRVRKEAEEKLRMEISAEKEKNRPVIGKKMTVVRGRKVPKGTVGIVCWISNKTGGVLIKDESVWKDRNAPGVWVNPDYLKAVDI